MDDAISNNDTWIRHALSLKEIKGEPPKMSPFEWILQLQKSCKKSAPDEQIGISGRLLSLIQDGIQAHATKIASQYKGRSFVGVSYQQIAIAKVAIGHLYYFSAQPLDQDFAHTNLQRIYRHDIEDDTISAEEAEMLHNAFNFATPGCTTMVELESKAGKAV